MKTEQVKRPVNVEGHAKKKQVVQCHVHRLKH